jgi:transposase
MESATNELATRVKELEADNAALSDALEQSEQKNKALEEKYKILERLHFGKKSERFVESEDQQLLFDEAELHADGKGTSVQIPKTIPVRAQTKKRGRKALQSDLPREEIVHDLSSEEKRCPCCGKERSEIGEERTEEVHIVPAVVSVRVHVRKKYGACSCTGSKEPSNAVSAVVTAPGEAKLIPGSSFSNETIALFLVWKYLDALPFYRIEKILPRYGIEVPRATLCNLAVGAGRALGGIIEAMWRDVRISPVIHMDETPVQVLKELGRPPEAKSYMWVTSGYRDEHPIILFHYHPTRSHIVPETTLEGFSGFLQTDGHAAYNVVCSKFKLEHVGCWAHIRREFYEASKISGHRGSAEKMLSLIRALYDIERDLRSKLADEKLDPESFLAERRDLTKPVFERIWEYLLELKRDVPPSLALGKAVSYALGQYSKAIRYVEHYLLTPDNNSIENAIRPFVIGRKNWLFSDTPRGCHASAGIYSVIETAKKNGHDPYRYLCHLFNELAKNPSLENLQRLLPYVLKPKSY